MYLNDSPLIRYDENISSKIFLIINIKIFFKEN